MAMVIQWRIVAAASAAALLMLASQYMIWVWSPVEAQMGIIQKIFYTHVALAWWGFVFFFLVFVFSVLYLVKRRERYHLLAGAAGEIGVLFSGLVLLTGMAWAKASWNTWWTSDPRLSTALVMWFVYSAYLLVRDLDPAEARMKTVAAVLGIVAFLDVPLVFFSARMWRSAHPSVVASRGGGLPESMALTLIVSLLAWGALCGLMFWLRSGQLEARNRIAELLWGDW